MKVLLVVASAGWVVMGLFLALGGKRGQDTMWRVFPRSWHMERQRRERSRFSEMWTHRVPGVGFVAVGVYGIVRALTGFD